MRTDDVQRLSSRHERNCLILMTRQAATDRMYRLLSDAIHDRTVTSCAAGPEIVTIPGARYDISQWRRRGS